MAIFLFGLSQQDLQLRFLEYGGLGGPWRLVSLSAYGDPENPEYAAIWHHDPGHPSQALALRVRAGELGVIDEMWNTYGMLPTVVTAVYGPAAPGSDYDIEGTNVRWNFVFEKSPQLYSDMQFFHWVPYDTLYQAQRAGPPGGFQGSVFGGSSSAPDRDIVSFDVIRTESGTVAYTGLLYPKTTPPVGTGLNTVNVTNPPGSSTWENHSDTRALRSGWARPELAVPHPVGVNGERTVVTQWRDDVLGPWPSNMVDGSFTGGAVVVGPIGLWNIQGAHDDMTAKGYLPYRIAVSGNWSEARVCIVYARSTVPLERKFVVVDARDPSPPARVGGTIKGAAKYRLFDLLASSQQGSWHTRAEVRAMPKQLPLRLPRRLPMEKSRSVRELDSRLVGATDIGENVYPAGGTVGGDPLFGGAGSASASSAQSGNLPFKTRYKAIDDWVRNRLETYGARAAQVAIARGGRLVVSRGYTLAENGYPVTWPTHLFCVGSISKALTGMAAAHHYFPNGEVSGLLTPLDEAFGLTDAVSPALRQKLGETPLFLLLRHLSGWPGDFNDAVVAATARDGAPLPPIPGDALKFVRKTNTDFYLPDVDPNPNTQTYMYQYSGATLRALSEAVSRRFGNPEGSSYQNDMPTSFWKLAPEKATVRGRTPLDAIEVKGCVPNHSAVIELLTVAQQGGPSLRLPLQFEGYPSFALGAGHWTMSAATLARILSGMDASATSVQPLLNMACVQSLIDGADPSQFQFGSALFAGSRAPSGRPFTRLLHNGLSYGVWAIAGINFAAHSSIPQMTAPTTCIAYHENFDNPTNAPLAVVLDNLLSLAETIEATYGWEGDDLFTLG